MRFLLVVSVVLLTGCASLSREECLTGDWHGIGYSDGLQGRAETYLQQHQQACAEHQIKINLDNYLAGREKGLQQFCLPANAYQQGRAGKTYNYVCPKAQEQAYLDAYNKGYAYYQQNEKVKKLQREINSEKRRIASLKEEILETEKKLVSDGLSKAERERLLETLREKEQRLPGDEYHYHRLQHELRIEQSNLRRLY